MKSTQSSINRLLSYDAYQLYLLPHKIEEFVYFYQKEKNSFPMDILREIRDRFIVGDKSTEMKMVLDLGCDTFSPQGATSPLEQSIGYNMTKSSVYLIEKGALDVLEEKEKGRLIHLAAQEGNFEIVVAFLKNKTNPSLTNEKGKTVWDVYQSKPVQKNLHKTAETLEQEKIDFDYFLLQYHLPQKDIKPTIKRI